MPNFYYAQARAFRHLANKQFLESLYISKKQRPSKSLKESFSGISSKISDCRAFSPFKTLPGFGHLATASSLLEFLFIIFRA